MTPAEERELVPELAAWNDGRGISLDDWAACVATPAQLIAAAQIFWPAFIEHDGCVLRASAFEASNYDAWVRQTGHDRGAIERVMNHVHVLDLFAEPAVEPSQAQVRYLGATLAAMWRAKLAAELPGRAFEVTFPPGPLDDLLDYEVTFCQVRPVPTLPTSSP